PLYEVDHSLDEVEIESPEDKQLAWKEKMQEANQKKSEKTANELEEAFNILDDQNTGSVPVVQIANYLEKSTQAIYMRVKRNPNFDIQDGMVTKSKEL